MIREESPDRINYGLCKIGQTSSRHVINEQRAQSKSSDWGAFLNICRVCMYEQRALGVEAKRESKSVASHEEIRVD